MIDERIEELVWTGETLPRIGDTCQVYMHNLGCGECIGYFVECGYLGVKVKLYYPPEWFKKQDTTNGVAYVFGLDLIPNKPKEGINS